MNQNIEQHYDTICFNQDCINIDQQLFLSKTQGKKHLKHRQKFCRKMQSQSFKYLYKLPAQIISNMMSKFKKKLASELKNRQNQAQKIFNKCYADQAKKFAKMCIKQFTYGECEKILKKLRQKSARSSHDYKEIMANIFFQKKNAIQEIIQKKLSEVSIEFQALSQKILNAFQSKISQIFTEKFDQVVIKQQEQDNQQEEYVNQQENQLIVSQNNHISPFLVENSQEKPLQQVEEITNNLTTRVHKIKNYVQFHNSGKNLTQYEVYTINSVNDALKLQKNNQYLNNSSLVLKCKIPFEVLINIIKKMKPSKIYLNAQTLDYNKDILSVLPNEVLNKLTVYEEDWQYNLYFKEYSNHLFFPNNQQQQVVTAKATNRTIRKLPKLQNLCIRNRSDINFISQSDIRLNNITSLRLESQEIQQINIKSLKNLLSKFQNLKTLVIKDLTLNEELIEAILMIIILNPKLQCLVLQDIDLMSQNFLTLIFKFQLKKLLIHLKTNQMTFFFHDLLKNYTLQFLSLKNMIFQPLYEQQQADKLIYYEKLKLSHLDLYNCGSQSGMVLFHLDQTILQHLNLGFSKFGFLSMIEQLAAKIKGFYHLQELNLDYTFFDLRNIIQAKGKYSTKLQKLSILGFVDPDYQDLLNYFLREGDLFVLLKSFKKLNYFNLSCPQYIKKIRRRNNLKKNFALCLNGIKK